MNINILGKFYLGNGGIGDCLLFLSTFYDQVDEANVIFLANDPNPVKELLDCFPKLKKKLVLANDFGWLKEFYNHPNLAGTGILPKNLDYSTWYKVDPIKEYGVVEHPEFVNLFDAKKVHEKQVFIQLQGSMAEGDVGKRRIIGETALKQIWQICEDRQLQHVSCDPNNGPRRPLKETLELIKGSDLLIGVDSFAKTFSHMCNISTIVYDNIYTDGYLNRFKDGIDYGHYVFLNWPFSLFTQNASLTYIDQLKKNLNKPLINKVNSHY